MCQTLSSMNVAVAKNKDGKEKSDGTVNFKKLLLMRCQAEFEKQRDTKDELRRDERLNDSEISEVNNSIFVETHAQSFQWLIQWK